MSEEARLELEQSAGEFRPEPDGRPKMPEPPPVRVVAVEDVVVQAAAGLERQLDEFYAGMLQFAKDEQLPLAYWGENVRVVFQVSETPPVRESYRVLQIEVQCLREVEQKLIDREIEYMRQRGLVAGSESLVLLDPAGNWVELGEKRRIL